MNERSCYCQKQLSYVIIVIYVSPYFLCRKYLNVVLSF